MVYKLNTFMTSGVSEYWMVDPEYRKITLYTFVNFGVDKMEAFKVGDTAKSFVFDGLAVDVKRLFDDM